MHTNDNFILFPPTWNACLWKRETRCQRRSPCYKIIVKKKKTKNMYHHSSFTVSSCQHTMELTEPAVFPQLLICALMELKGTMVLFRWTFWRCYKRLRLDEVVIQITIPADGCLSCTCRLNMQALLLTLMMTKHAEIQGSLKLLQ